MSEAFDPASAEYVHLQDQESRIQRRPTNILDCPNEVLLRVVQYFKPVGLIGCWTSQERRCPITFPRELGSLRAVSRRWREIVKTAFPACILYKGYLNETGQHFRDALQAFDKQGGRYESVEHLHLDWGRYSLRDLESLVKPFPALVLLDVHDLSARCWLAFAGNVTRLLTLEAVKVAFSDLDWDRPMAPLSNTRLALSSVKKVGVHNIYCKHLKHFLDWFPSLEHLVVGSVKEARQSDLSAGLRSCPKSIKTLGIYGFWNGPGALDLRFLDTVERFEIACRLDFYYFIHQYPEHRIALKLAESVTQIIYSRREKLRRCGDCGSQVLTETDSLRKLAQNSNEIAPGLQSVVIRLCPGAGLCILCRRILQKWG